jgi:rare lipoprotein A
MKTTAGMGKSNGLQGRAMEAEQNEHVRLARMRRAAALGIVRLTAVGLAVSFSGCAARQPSIPPKSSPTAVLETRVGLASYYGEEFHGRMTASGVRFDMNAMVAAHPSYPFGTRLRVTNLANRRSTVVRIVDRGPTPRLRAQGLLIDVSRRAAEVLGFLEQGRVRVQLEVLAWGAR